LLLVIGSVWLGGAVGAWLLARAWVWREIRVQAERHGARLSDCSLHLGLRSIVLERCDVQLLPDAGARGWPLGGVTVNGSIGRIDIELSGLSPARLRLRAAQLVAVGQPRLVDVLQSGSAPVPSLPMDVEQSTLAWSPEAGAGTKLVLSNLAYEAAARRFLSKLDIPGRAQGELSLGPDGMEVTLGDSSRPSLRLRAHFIPDAQRAALDLELRRWPLRDLEGPWLELTETLRPIELEGRVSLKVPLGLSMELPGGDLHLTLHGLNFPVPREVEGLVHGSPPKLSGRFSLNRLLDHATFPQLSFLTGALGMNGTAELWVSGSGLAFRSSSSGPLPCHAIAESAVRAHAGSAIAKLAGRIAKRALSGSVQIVAALEGHTSELARAQVLTTIGVGCGLEPLPIDVGVTRELLEGLPEEVVRQMSRLEKLPSLPELRAPRGLMIPDRLSWPPPRVDKKRPEALPPDGH
jgi:hypothetical protein